MVNRDTNSIIRAAAGWRQGGLAGAECVLSTRSCAEPSEVLGKVIIVTVLPDDIKFLKQCLSRESSVNT